MKKISDYVVISSCFQKKFNEEANKLIREGWQPLGGVSISHQGPEDGSGSTEFAQAMVRYSK
jgi:hypothetical protein